MMEADGQKRQFQDRLKRISAGGENTMTQVYVGPAEDAAPRKPSRRVPSPVPSLRETLAYPATAAMAFGLGLLAVVATRWIRYRLADGALIGEDADITMAIDAGMALAIGLALKSMFRLSGKVRQTAMTAGVLVMVFFMHNMVHLWPGLFERAFSRDWVTAVVETTQPKSVLFRGQSFVMGEDENAPVMPKLLELNK